MRKKHSLVVMTVIMIFSPTTYGQISGELEDACHGDVDIVEYVYQYVEAGIAPISDYISDEEAAQIATILGGENVSNLSSKDKFSEVMLACVEGRIFQQRNSNIINQQ